VLCSSLPNFTQTAALCHHSKATNHKFDYFGICGLPYPIPSPLTDHWEIWHDVRLNLWYAPCTKFSSSSRHCVAPAWLETANMTKPGTFWGPHTPSVTRGNWHVTENQFPHQISPKGARILDFNVFSNSTFCDGAN